MRGRHKRSERKPRKDRHDGDKDKASKDRSRLRSAKKSTNGETRVVYIPNPNKNARIQNIQNRPMIWNLQEEIRRENSIGTIPKLTQHANSE